MLAIVLLIAIAAIAQSADTITTVESSSKEEITSKWTEVVKTEVETVAPPPPVA
jgi:hypothetical protein